MEIVAAAKADSTKIHFDSMYPTSAQVTFDLLNEAVKIYPNLGCTLPARWDRSLADTAHVIESQCSVRVVKGQWADPLHQDIDIESNYEAIVRALAGKVPKVSIASHDPELVETCLDILIAAGTPCELELLYGLPMGVSRIADRKGIPKRVYVPFGIAYLPYALSDLRRRPRILLWIVKDIFTRAFGLEGKPSGRNYGEKNADSEEGTIEILRDKRSLLPLRKEWNELADQMENPLLRHEWIVSAANSFFTDEEIYFFICRKQGQICAIAPLVKVGKGFRGRLLLIGFLYLYEPADFLYKDEESLEILMTTIARQRYPVIFTRIPHGNPIPGFSIWRTRNRFINAKIIGQSHSPFLDISSNWDDFYRDLTSKNRNDLSRAHKKATAIGSIDFEICQVNWHTNAHYFQNFLSVELNSWKAKKGSAISSTSQLKGFFETFTSQASNDNHLYYAYMKIDGLLVAAQFFTIQYDRLWILKITHDERLGSCSPGALLMCEVVRFAFENNLSGIEFLGFSEPWLNKWATGHRSYMDFAYSPLSLAGLVDRSPGVKARLFRISSRMRSIAQRLRGRLP
ncbi:MAG: GNAT family N-acetyltransferase [Gammaproteobacteria bacterium]|nr:GNAT family N-acetyltransferase [Gammaproteobacteria bacterium]